jgi:hypothetical protein
MGSGDFSSDLSLGVLTPTPSVRPTEGHSPRQDAEAKARRRPRPEPENPDGDTSADAGDAVTHQIDRLA